MAIQSYRQPGQMLEAFRQDPVQTLTESLEPFLDKSSILSLDRCQRIDSEELKGFFVGTKYNFSELQIAADHALKIGTRHDGPNYSTFVRQAECELESMRNICSALEEKKDSECVLYRSDLGALENTFLEMRKQIPLGRSKLMQHDLNMLKQLNTLPTSQTYTVGDIEYQEPRVTPGALQRWFGKFLDTNAYESITVGFKLQSLYGKPLEGSVTLVAFKKRLYKPSHLERFTANVTHSLPIHISQFVYGSQRDEVAEDTQSLILQNPNCIANCKGELNADILASWNFERCDVYKTEQMLEMGISKEFSEEADCFILYHRKA